MREDIKESGPEILTLIDELVPKLNNRLQQQTMMREVFEHVSKRLRDAKFDEKVITYLDDWMVGEKMYITSLIWKCGIFIIKVECETKDSKTIVTDDLLERASFNNLTKAYFGLKDFIDVVEATMKL